jgi:hypothetical protein
MSPRDTFCPECGERVARMDGKSNRQLRAEEDDWDRELSRMEAFEEDDGDDH